MRLSQNILERMVMYVNVRESMMKLKNSFKKKIIQKHAKATLIDFF
jgi:hypothetical protein